MVHYPRPTTHAHMHMTRSCLHAFAGQALVHHPLFSFVLTRTNQYIDIIITELNNNIMHR